MGKKGDSENLRSSFRIAPKNLKKFVVVYHEKMYLYAYFHIFLSSRVLRRKKFSNYRFFPMLFKWEMDALWGDSNRLNWILSPYGIFFIIFLETFYMVTLMKKSIWEIRNALINIAQFVSIVSKLIAGGMYRSILHSYTIYYIYMRRP